MVFALLVGLRIFFFYPPWGSKTPSTSKVCSGHDTKLDLIATLQFWKWGEYGVFCHCYYSQVHSDSKW